MITGNEKLEGMAGVGKETADRSSLANVLLITSDWKWAASVEKILIENFYGAKVALNGDQVVERMKDTLYHMALIDLDSTVETADRLVSIIRQIKPHIPIIGMGDHASGSCPGMICFKKPLKIELLKVIFPQAGTVKVVKTGSQTLKGIFLGVVSALFLWGLLILIWG